MNVGNMAAALNNNMLSVEMSPVFSQLEPLLLQHIAQRFGLGEQAAGLLVSGGSLGNLQAIAVARNSHFPVLEKGLVSLDQQPVLFASEIAHTSIQKAAMVWRRNFQISAPYMGEAGSWQNLGESSIQGTRHVDVLKLWLSLQHLGEAGYASILEHNFRLTQRFVRAVRDRPHLRLASQPQLNLICFRSEPQTLAPEQWDDWNERLQQHLLSEGNTFLSLPLYRGQRWLKAVLLNPFTQEYHLDRLFDCLDAFHSVS